MYFNGKRTHAKSTTVRKHRFRNSVPSLPLCNKLKEGFGSLEWQKTMFVTQKLACALV